MYIHQEEKKSPFRLLIKILITAGGILAGFLLARIFFVPFVITDDSMEPGLHAGQRIIVMKHITPKTGDLILIQNPAEPDRVLLKRVIAGEGDTVEIRNKVVFINNKKFDFTWKIISGDGRIFPMGFTSRDTMPFIKIDRKKYFVLGDNIDFSTDSRFIGPVDEENVIGRLLFAF